MWLTGLKAPINYLHVTPGQACWLGQGETQVTKTACQSLILNFRFFVDEYLDLVRLAAVVEVVFVIVALFESAFDVLALCYSLILPTQLRERFEPQGRRFIKFLYYYYKIQLPVRAYR